MANLAVGIDPSGAKRGAEEVRRSLDLIEAEARAVGAAIRDMTQGTERGMAAFRGNSSATAEAIAGLKQRTAELGVEIGSNLRRGLDQAGQGFESLKGRVVNLRTAFAAVGAGLFVADMLNVASEVAAVEAQLTRLTGSAQGAAEASRFLWAEADRLGLRIEGVEQAFINLLPSVNTGAFSMAEAKELLAGFGEAAVATGRSSDELAGALQTLVEAARRPAITFEDLERVTRPFPGLYAAMEVASGQAAGGLKQLADEGRITQDYFKALLIPALSEFTAAAESLQDTPARAMARVSNAIRQVRETMAVPFADAVTPAITALARAMADPQLREGAARLGQALGDVAAVLANGGLASAVRFVADNFDLLYRAAQLFIGLKVASFLVGVGRDLRSMASGAQLAARSVRDLILAFGGFNMATAARGAAMVGAALAGWAPVLVAAGALMLPLAINTSLLGTNATRTASEVTALDAALAAFRGAADEAATGAEGTGQKLEEMGTAALRAAQDVVKAAEAQLAAAQSLQEAQGVMDPLRQMAFGDTVGEVAMAEEGVAAARERLAAVEAEIEAAIGRPRGAGPRQLDRPGGRSSPPPPPPPPPPGRAGTGTQLSEAERALQSLREQVGQLQIANTVLNAEVDLIGQSNTARERTLQLVEAKANLEAAGVAGGQAELAALEEQLDTRARLQQLIASREASQGALQDAQQSLAYDRQKLAIIQQFPNARSQERASALAVLDAQRQIADEVLPETREQLLGIAEEQAAVARATEEAIEQQERYAQASREVADAIAGGFTNAVLEANSLQEALLALEQDLLRILANQLITQPLSAGIEGSLLSLGSMGFGLFGGGGAGTGTAVASSGSFGGAASTASTGSFFFGLHGGLDATRGGMHGWPRLHDGLRSDEFPAILQRGEEVVSRSAVDQRKLGPIAGDVLRSPGGDPARRTFADQGRYNITINVPNQGGSGMTPMQIAMAARKGIEQTRRVRR